jgi:hypothetical protein
MPYKDLADQRLAQRRHYLENKDAYVARSLAAKIKTRNENADQVRRTHGLKGWFSDVAASVWR